MKSRGGYTQGRNFQRRGGCDLSPASIRRQPGAGTPLARCLRIPRQRQGGLGRSICRRRPVRRGQYGKNVRDRGGETQTPMQQGSSVADRELTAAIREAIVEDNSLSSYAHNVKIITENGVVTLRGPVKTPAEKAAVVAKAEQAKG